MRSVCDNKEEMRRYGRWLVAQRERLRSEETDSMKFDYPWTPMRFVSAEEITMMLGRVRVFHGETNVRIYDAVPVTRTNTPSMTTDRYIEEPGYYRVDPAPSIKHNEYPGFWECVYTTVCADGFPNCEWSRWAKLWIEFCHDQRFNGRIKQYHNLDRKRLIQLRKPSALKMTRSSTQFFRALAMAGSVQSSKQEHQ